MPKTGTNVYKRKDGRWEGRLPIGRENGTTRYVYVYASTYEGTISKLAAAANQIRQPAPAVRTENSFASVAAEWLGLHKAQLKESSVSKYMVHLDQHLLPVFAGRQITEITRGEVTAFCGELLSGIGEDKKALAPATVNSLLSVMKNIFSYASQEKGLPVADIQKISAKPVKATLRVFTLAEQQNLCEYLHSHLTEVNLGILLCLYTGLRVGELCALKWEDISFESQSLYVCKTMQRIRKPGESKTEIVLSPPKTASSVRTVPIPDAVFDLLKANRKEGESWLLTGETEHYLEPRAMQYRFKTILKKCGVDDANFHTTRHTFATRCVELGVDYKSLSEVLGHASVNVTLNRYVHPSMEQKLKGVNLLSNLFTVK